MPRTGYKPGSGHPVEKLGAVQRRREIARILLEKGGPTRITTAEIQMMLYKRGYRTNEGKAFTRTLIHKDIRLLERMWKAEATKDIAEHKSMTLEKYHLLWEASMKENDLTEARRVLNDMRAMMGMDAPEVKVYEQVSHVMDQAYERLYEEFGDDSDTWKRILHALMGSDHQPEVGGSSSLPN